MVSAAAAALGSSSSVRQAAGWQSLLQPQAWWLTGLTRNSGCLNDMDVGSALWGCCMDNLAMLGLLAFWYHACYAFFVHKHNSYAEHLMPSACVSGWVLVGGTAKVALRIPAASGYACLPSGMECFVLVAACFGALAHPVVRRFM